MSGEKYPSDLPQPGQKHYYGTWTVAGCRNGTTGQVGAFVQYWQPRGMSLEQFSALAPAMKTAGFRLQFGSRLGRFAYTDVGRTLPASRAKSHYTLWAGNAEQAADAMRSAEQAAARGQS